MSIIVCTAIEVIQVKNTPSYIKVASVRMPSHWLSISQLLKSPPIIFPGSFEKENKNSVRFLFQPVDHRLSAAAADDYSGRAPVDSAFHITAVQRVIYLG